MDSLNGLLGARCRMISLKRCAEQDYERSPERDDLTFEDSNLSQHSSLPFFQWFTIFITLSAQSPEESLESIMKHFKIFTFGSWIEVGNKFEYSIKNQTCIDARKMMDWRRWLDGWFPEDLISSNNDVTSARLCVFLWFRKTKETRMKETP